MKFFEVNPLAAINPDDELDAHIGEISRNAARRLKKGEDVLIYTPADQNLVHKSRGEALRDGVNETGLSESITLMLAEIARNIHSEVEFSKLILGGGNTAVTVCRRLGVIGNVVLEEIESGLPTAFAIGVNGLLLVQKSGSFGDEDFYFKAIEKLNATVHRKASG